MNRFSQNWYHSHIGMELLGCYSFNWVIESNYLSIELAMNQFVNVWINLNIYVWKLAPSDNFANRVLILNWLGRRKKREDWMVIQVGELKGKRAKRRENIDYLGYWTLYGDCYRIMGKCSISSGSKWSTDPVIFKRCWRSNKTHTLHLLRLK